MNPIPMKAYLTLRCCACANRSFRSVFRAERHSLEQHGGRVRFTAEWVGLPATLYKGGEEMEPYVDKEQGNEPSAS